MSRWMRVAALVGDWLAAHPSPGRLKRRAVEMLEHHRVEPHRHRDRVVDRVKLGEVLAVLAVGRGCRRAGRQIAPLDAAQTLDHVLGPHRLAELTVAGTSTPTSACLRTTSATAGPRMRSNAASSIAWPSDSARKTSATAPVGPGCQHGSSKRERRCVPCAVPPKRSLAGVVDSTQLCGGLRAELAACPGTKVICFSSERRI